MTEAIVVALITAAASIFGSYLLYHKSSKEQIEKMAKSEQKTMDRLEAIEKKLDIHNGYALKFEDIRVSIAEIRTEIKNIK